VKLNEIFISTDLGDSSKYFIETKPFFQKVFQIKSWSGERFQNKCISFWVSRS